MCAVVARRIVLTLIALFDTTRRNGRIASTALLRSSRSPESESNGPLLLIVAPIRRGEP